MPRPGWDARFAGLVGPGSGDLVGATGIAAQMVGCWGGGPPCSPAGSRQPVSWPIRARPGRFTPEVS